MEGLYQANQAVGQSYAAQQAKTDYHQSAAQQTVMSAAHMELDSLINAASRNTQQLREMKERMFGQTPERNAGSATTPRPVPNGSVQLLGEKVEMLKNILRDQTALVDELLKVG